MKLKTALEIGIDCGLETIGESLYNIQIHSSSLFTYAEINKELNELGFKTRMGRNCDTGTLSIAVLEEPETENI